MGYIYIYTVGWVLGFSVALVASTEFGVDKVQCFSKETASRVTITSPLLGHKEYFSNVRTVSWFI